MSETGDILQQATVLLADVARADFAGISDVEICALTTAVEAVGRLADAARVMVAAEVAERSRCELGSDGLSMRNGFRKPIGLLEHLTRVAPAELRGRVRVGEAVRPRVGLSGETVHAEFALLGEQVTGGSVGIEAASAIVTQLRLASTGSAATDDNLCAAETALVELAAHESTEVVTIVARQWRCALDPDGIEPGYDEIRSRRGLTKGRMRNGITPWRIAADPETSALMDAMLSDAMAPGAVPRFLATDEMGEAAEAAEAGEAGVAGEGGVAGEAGVALEVPADPRTRAQKQLDMLAGVLTAGMRASHDAPPAMRATAQVMATVTLAELEAGVGAGWLQGIDEPIPVGAIRRMACDAGVRVSVLGEGGVALFEAAMGRFFTPAQRRGMMVRDGDRCCGPGCSNPASWCDAHHVVSWSRSGPTCVDNGVLLCGSCHAALHSGAFELRMTDGLPYWRLSIDFWDDSAWRRAGRSQGVRLIA
jgi:hypothetical protein